MKHPANWSECWSAKDFARWGVNVVEVPDEQPEPSRRLVQKIIIIERLNDLGLLETARIAMDSADLLTRERWNARTEFYADDAETIAFLKSIGADPTQVLY